MKYIYLILVVACSVMSIGCQTTESEQINVQLPELEFPNSTPYVLDTSSIEEPDPPNFIFMVMGEDGLRTAGDGEDPTHIVMLQEDLNKIDAMLDVKIAYKQISTEQTMLINIEREKSNALKDMIILERQSRILERHLRMEVEKSYKGEKREHRLDNIINRITWIGAIVGGIIICAL